MTVPSSTPSRPAQLLVVIETEHGGGLRRASLNAIRFAERWAAAVGGGYSLLLCGHLITELASSLASYGANRVFVVDSPSLASAQAELHAPAIAEVVESQDFDAVVACATSWGKDVLPRVAGLLDAAFVGDCVAVESSRGRVLLVRAVNAGNAFARCEVHAARTVLTIRQSEFEPAVPVGGHSDLVTVVAPAVRAESQQVRELGFEPVRSSRPDLSDARVVVSGGRALDARFFDVLGPLADELGAAIGATRAACDAGFAPGDFQVGQTGKVVAPELYFAVGISGAIQHIAGIKGARTVVAVNSDPEAPIFSIADYGLVGDLFELIPALVRAIAQYRTNAA